MAKKKTAKKAKATGSASVKKYSKSHGFTLPHGYEVHYTVRKKKR